MIELTLTPQPPTTNHVYKSHCRFNHPTVYMTAEGKAIKQAYQLQARAQYKGKPLEGELEMWITYHFDTKAKRDNDNFKKILKDSLSGICWLDDSQVFCEHSTKIIGAAESKVEIIIKPWKPQK